MAKYLVLIYGDEQAWDAFTPEQWRDNGEGHRAFNEAVAAADGAAVLGGAQLREASTATTLRAGSAGRPSITDGPFPETKEVLGGFYLIEATDLDQAIAFVGLLREVSAGHSGVEIRPVLERS